MEGPVLLYSFLICHAHFLGNEITGLEDKFLTIGATACYLICAVSSIPVIGLIACAFTGFCVSMMWPGCLVVGAEKVPTGGVFIYAMMAAGGDFGASVGPQLIGVITDTVMANPTAAALAESWGMLPDQLGMKLGMLVGMLFPLVGIFVYLHILRTKKKAIAA